MMRRYSMVIVAVIAVTFLPLAAVAQSVNVILMIGDGMGPEQVKAASLYEYGEPGRLCFEQFDARGVMTTSSADNAVTDSAAAGTALATGQKVNNGVLSVAIPGDRQPLATILEFAQDFGMRTGLITTTTLTHATPAAFASHQPSRDLGEQIAADYLVLTRPNVLMGGGTDALPAQHAVAAGYAVVHDRSQLQQLARADGVPLRVCGIFGEGHMPYEYMDGKQSSSAYDHLPHLSEMTAAALQLLANDGPGFFLMVEGGRIDHAGHSKGLDNHEDRTMSNIGETIEFARAVQVVIDWAAKQDDTLLIVTADHECGGLMVVESNGPGNMPTVTWAGTDHTGIPVPVYASGPGAEQFRGSLDNTDLFPRMRQIIEQRIAEPAVAVE